MKTKSKPDLLKEKENQAVLTPASNNFPKEPFFIAGRAAVRSAPMQVPKTAEELRAHVRRFKEEHKEVLDALVVDTLRLNSFGVVWEPQTAFVVSSLVAAGHLDEAGLQLVLVLAVGGDPTLDASALNPSQEGREGQL